MKTNDIGLAIIRKWEGCKLEAYQCPASVWTIGYGNTMYEDGTRVKKGDKITKERAGTLLTAIVAQFEPYVKRAVKVKLSENQFSALVCLCYNIGPGRFAKCELVQVLNGGDYANAAELFGKYVTAGGKTLKGIVDRRNEEKRLFLTA